MGSALIALAIAYYADDFIGALREIAAALRERGK